MKTARKTYQLSGIFWHEGKQVVGKCPELGVSSFGKDVEEAKDRLKEAVALYLENAKALGLLGDLEETLYAGERFATTIEVPA